MRPLRKSAMWDAFQDEYGKQTAGGQLLAYFCLICILAVLAMILGGQVLVDVAPPAYAGAASLIPLTALGFVGPALYRTVNQNVALPNKRPFFIAGVISAALLFIGDHSAARARDRRLRGADRDDRRLRRSGDPDVHPRPARKEAALSSRTARSARRSCSLR